MPHQSESLVDFVAILLLILKFQGATIVDERVCITHWGTYADESYSWNGPSWKNENNFGPPVCIHILQLNSRISNLSDILGQNFNSSVETSMVEKNCSCM